MVPPPVTTSFSAQEALLEVGFLGGGTTIEPIEPSCGRITHTAGKLSGMLPRHAELQEFASQTGYPPGVPRR
jgi:hypothetical protein